MKIKRDIKSSNIIIINYTFVKIIDFGMAKKVQSPNQLQTDSNTTVVGTVAYMVKYLNYFSFNLNSK
jgi:serine/threonine protein kinase